jgi:hypothetical protein
MASLEQAQLASTVPSPSAFLAVPIHDLGEFSAALVNHRKAAAAVPNAVRSSDIGHSLYLQHIATVTNQALASLLLTNRTAPIGMLNLERLEIFPSGIERGELIGTVPLAPLEETAVIHKEWSVTSKEFTSIVTDSLESVSETGVTDNTELSQSTISQIQHGNQFNITGTVSGGIPLISGSSTTGFTDQGSNSLSATDSRKHATAVTSKASSRSKQEHKVTISTKTETGTSETTTRILKNPSPTDPIRIDYFSLMRKWHVRLYRYGLRLTYDIVIPEPAGAMRAVYAQIKQLRAKLGPFQFTIKPSDISNDIIGEESKSHYLVLADEQGSQVPLYPPSPGPLTPNGHLGTNRGWTFYDLEFDVTPGYMISEVFVDAQIGDRPEDPINFSILGSNYARGGVGGALIIRSEKVLNSDNTGFLHDAIGHQKVTFFFHHADQAWVGLTIKLLPSANKIDQWRTDVWNALYNAAQMRYMSEQQNIQGQISQLEYQISNVDTLTLRREESDEIMKGVLRFILGNGFEFMPDVVLNAIKGSKADVDHGVGFTGHSLGLDPAALALVQQYENIVRFINQAIEWENVVTFLYSYFWDVPPSWDFIRQIRHPDSNRQAFLRAGSARVVLTIRKGWEEAWVRFQDTGDPYGISKSQYLTVAREIAAYDDRHYPGIPPANPGKEAARLEDAVYTTGSEKLDPSPNPVIINVESSSGFIAGLPVVIDGYDPANPIQESQMVTAIPSATEIVVRQLSNPHGASGAFPIIQPGEKGVLIAEWNEYTPSSGTDIEVTSNLTTIN